jgi:hypothetical protein
MQDIEAEACHKRAWACLRTADHENHQGRRAILISAAYTWETLAQEIDEAADREVDRMAIALNRTDVAGRLREFLREASRADLMVEPAD